MRRNHGLLVLVLVLSNVAALRAQQTKSPQIVGLFRDVVAPAGKSTVRLLVDQKDAALGIVVGADGLLLSKHSELKDKKIVCRLPSGHHHNADIVAFDDAHDLALLKIDVTGLVPAQWTDSKSARLGHWVASAGVGNEPVAIGVVSVTTREIKGAKYIAPSGAPGGYLGLALDLDFAMGVKVQEVLSDTPAQKAGLKNEDRIIAINGKNVASPDEFLALLSKSKPGDMIQLKVAREEKEHDIPATLGQRPGTKGGKSRGEIQNAMGSKLSDRRAGFPVILQHDSILKPTDCGSPLVNLEGQVVGINIARAGRTESYAIPSETVLSLLQKWKVAP